jgi:hypothetical protein
MNNNKGLRKISPKDLNMDNPLQAEGAARGRDAMHHVSTTEGLKARQSLAQGNALWHEQRLSVPKAPTGRNQDRRITPFQGLTFARHSFRRALPCAIDYAPSGHPFCILHFAFRSNHFGMGTL